MPKFLYKVHESSGAIATGEIESVDRFVAASDLRMQGKVVISVEEIKERESSILRLVTTMFRGVGAHDLIMFAHNMSAMMTAGLSLSRALAILERQTQNVSFKKALHGISEEIARGGTLSSGMEHYPNIFSKLFVAMVRAGEGSGSLSQSLIVVGTQLEKSYNLQNKIKSALVYPAVVLMALVGVGAIMMIYVVPTLATTFRDLNTELPKSTQLVIAISDALTNHPVIILALLALVLWGIRTVLRTTAGSRLYETLILSIPLIGELVRQSNAARTARSLSSLLTSGVPMLESIVITREVLQNSHYKDVLKDAEARVQKGTALSSIFADHSDVYPIFVSEMTEVGEETGKLSHMLMNVASFYEDEVDRATKNMSAIVEPILMIFVGASVGFFALSVITPIYGLVNAI